jgi:23S rRNA pseudouridine1911/1915/1917 synthase
VRGDEDDRIRVRVEEEVAGRRLDKALHRLLPDYSRTHLKRLIKRGRVKVEGRAVKPSHLAEAGERVEIDLGRIRADARAALEELPIRVLHEDRMLVVIDKPPGVTVHPNSGIQEGTVAQWAEWKYGPLPRPDGEEQRPGVVHRLDRDTSGVMVLARTEAAMEELKTQFRKRITRKRYLALVHGVPEFDSDWVEKQIARDTLRPGRMRVVEEDGRDSRTYWERLEDLGSWALLRCEPRTGRTHQIRVHLASMGHSIVGDRLYRCPHAQRHPLPREAPPCRRQALHASCLTLLHPANQDEVSYECPPPPDMARLLEWLRRRREGGGP